MTIQIVIDVAGEAAGSPGASRVFDYSKIVTPAEVTLSLDDDTGITEYLWAIVSQPDGASAVLSSTTAAAPTFTPTANLPGSYLVECTVNGDEDYARNGLAYQTEHLGLRKPAPTETTQFSATRGWAGAMASLIDEVDTLGGQSADSGIRRRAVKDVVAGTSAPPTESEGDRYIVTGTPIAAWDGAGENDVVTFNGTVWEAVSPSEGWIAYVDAQDVDYRYVDDGAGAWEAVAGGGGMTFNYHIWIDADNGSDVDGDGTQGSPFATLAAAAASIAVPANFPEFATPVAFHVGPGVYNDSVILPYRVAIAIIGYGCLLTGDINWPYKFEYHFGQPELYYPPLLTIRAEPKLSMLLGDIWAGNADNTQQALPNRRIHIEGCQIDGEIINVDSTTTTAGNHTGPMEVHLDSCIPAGPFLHGLGGLREPSSPGDEPNTIHLYANSSILPFKICGCVTIENCSDSTFQSFIRYDRRPDVPDSPTVYAGEIGGSASDVGFADCSFLGSDYDFGWDGATGSQPDDVRLDASSLRSMDQHTPTYSNGTSFILQDGAEGVGVDNSGWSGNLGSEEDVQAALDTIDGLSLNPTIYDDTTTFTDVAASGGTDTQELDIGAIDDGIVEAVQFSITSGTSDDTTIQFYDANPSTGNLIYEAPNLALVANALDDRNCWYADLPTTGELWVKVTNDSTSQSSYSMRLRVKGDA